MDRLEMEFRGLKKGDLTLRECSHLFLEKMNLVGHVVPTVKERIKSYLRGATGGHDVHGVECQGLHSKGKN